MARRRSDFDNSLRDHVKETVTMHRVLEILSLEPPDRSGKIKSIINHGERTPSLHIYSYHWHDFSSGQRGDQIEFVQQYTGCSYREALDKLSGGTTSFASKRRREWKPPPPPDRPAPPPLFGRGRRALRFEVGPPDDTSARFAYADGE